MTYEQEKTRLWEWCKEEMKKIDDIHSGEGLDGPESKESWKFFREYNRRRLALKEKYGIPLNEEQKEHKAKLDRMKAEGLF